MIPAVVKVRMMMKVKGRMVVEIVGSFILSRQETSVMRERTGVLMVIVLELVKNSSKKNYKGQTNGWTRDRQMDGHGTHKGINTEQIFPLKWQMKSRF